MRFKLNFFLILSVVGLVFVFGCSKDGINPLNSSSEEAKALADLKGTIAHSPYFDNSAQGDSSSTSGESTSGYSFNNVHFDGFLDDPDQGWFRAIDWTTYTRKIGITSLDLVNGTATISITNTLSGNLKIGANFWNILSGTIIATKPISHYNIRKATFERIDGVWTLKKITALFSSSYDSGVTPDLNIEWVKVYNMAADTVNPVITITDTDTFYDKESLPHVPQNTLIKVEMKTVNNISGTNLCFLHHGLSRDKMYDDGTTFGDAAAGDNIYTIEYNTGSSAVVRQAFFDVIDKNSIYDNSNTTNYHSVLWAIPYIIQ